MKRLSKEKLNEYMLLALTDEAAPQIIFSNDENGEAVLLSVAENILSCRQKAGHFENYPMHKKVSAVKRLLSYRCDIINKRFSWNDDKKKKFIRINNEILDSCEKAWCEALLVAENLEKRIRQNNSFLTDYEISVEMNAYPDFGNKNICTAVKTFYIDELQLRSFITISNGQYDKINYVPQFIDKSKNWNTKYFGNEFKNDYICRAVHKLLDTGIWSFEEILSLTHVWIEVNVVHERLIKLAKEQK